METNVEFEAYLTKSELANFLKSLAEQVEKGNEIKVTSENQEISLNFTEPVEVEVEFDGKKLKVKIEFKQRSKLVI